MYDVEKMPAIDSRIATHTHTMKKMLFLPNIPALVCVIYSEQTNQLENLVRFVVAKLICWLFFVVVVVFFVFFYRFHRWRVIFWRWPFGMLGIARVRDTNSSCRDLHNNN